MDSQWKSGQHVKMRPHTDAFMQGDRFGVIEAVGTKYLHVKMARSERVLIVTPSSVERTFGEYL